MRRRWRGSFGMGALCGTFLLGLLLALFLPGAATALLCLVLVLAAVMFVSLLRC